MSPCAVFLLGALALGACAAPTVPSVAEAEPRPDGAIEVAHPPPAALPEFVSKAPSNDALWLDGHWIWRGQSWAWQRGGWIRVPQGTTATDWRVWYEPDGRMLFTESLWFNPDGSGREAPPIVTAAGSPTTPTLSEEATTP